MAERRMFAKSVIASDEFRTMGAGAQALYFQLAMEADDDGIVGSPIGIRRACGLTEDDLAELTERGFVIAVDGVAVIAHWRLMNTIQKDRYRPTVYTGVLEKLRAGAAGVLTLIGGSDLSGGPDAEKPQEDEEKERVSMLYTGCIQTDSKVETQVSLGKVSLIPLPHSAGAREGWSGVADGGEAETDTGAVQLSAQERGRLCLLMGAELRDGYIAHLADYLNAHPGKTYTDHCKVILRWWEEDKRKKRTLPLTDKQKAGSFDTTEMFEAALARTYRREEDDDEGKTSTG